jgi:hypothetical protein
MIQTTRRGLILGMGASLLAAPAIVRASSLMPVKLVDWGVYESNVVTVEGFSDAVLTVDGSWGAWIKRNGGPWEYVSGAIPQDGNLEFPTSLAVRGGDSLMICSPNVTPS